MKKRIILKSLLRHPVRVLVCVLLLTVSAAAFLANVIELGQIERQAEQSLSYYRQVGYLSVAGGEENTVMPLEPDCVEQIVQSPYVAYTNQTASWRGVSEDVLTDISWMNGSYHGANTVYLYGIVQDKKKNYGDSGMIVQYEDASCEKLGVQYFDRVDAVQLSISEVIAGEAERLPLAEMWFEICGTEAELDAFYEEAEIGKEYLFQIELGMPPKDRVQAGYVRRLEGMDCWMYPTENGRPDLTRTEFAGLKTAMERVTEDLHMFRMIACTDMSIMPAMQNRDFFVREGRMLNQSDTEQKRPVCVVSNSLASLRRLSVGDVISFEIGRNESTHRTQTLALQDDARWDEWYSAEKITVELEIVGTLDSLLLDGLYGEIYGPDVYFPESLLPEAWRKADSRILMEDEFSFVLKSPQDAEEFCRENDAALRAAGHEIVLADCGWEEFAVAASEMKSGNWLGIAVFGCVLLVVQCLVLVFLFRSVRKESAVMRALGVTAKEVRRQWQETAGTIGVIGIAAGGILACRYADYSIQKALEGFEVVSGGVSLFGMCAGATAGVLLVFLLLVTVSGRKFDKKQLIRQMQQEAS